MGPWSRSQMLTLGKLANLNHSLNGGLLKVFLFYQKQARILNIKVSRGVFFNPH